MLREWKSALVFQAELPQCQKCRMYLVIPCIEIFVFAVREVSIITLWLASIETRLGVLAYSVHANALLAKHHYYRLSCCVSWSLLIEEQYQLWYCVEKKQTRALLVDISVGERKRGQAKYFTVFMTGREICWVKWACNKSPSTPKLVCFKTLGLVNTWLAPVGDSVNSDSQSHVRASRRHRARRWGALTSRKVNYPDTRDNYFLGRYYCVACQRRVLMPFELLLCLVGSERQTVNSPSS